jgi:Ca-activated chloride channel homolog
VEEADKNLKAKAFYNKGVSLQQQKKLPACIDAYKNALRINPADAEARQNLQKALEEQKQQQNKDQKKDQPKKQEQKKKPPPEPKPQKSKLSQKQVEQYLQSLREKEKQVQQRVAKQRVGVPKQPEKDW